MNWKENYYKQEMRFANTEEMFNFISTEIIEKLIEDIPDTAFLTEPFTLMNGDKLKQQLRDKYL